MSEDRHTAGFLSVIYLKKNLEGEKYKKGDAVSKLFKLTTVTSTNFPDFYRMIQVRADRSDKKTMKKASEATG